MKPPFQAEVLPDVLPVHAPQFGKRRGTLPNKSFGPKIAPTTEATQVISLEELQPVAASEAIIVKSKTKEGKASSEAIYRLEPGTREIKKLPLPFGLVMGSKVQ